MAGSANNPKGASASNSGKSKAGRWFRRTYSSALLANRSRL